MYNETKSLVITLLYSIMNKCSKCNSPLFSVDTLSVFSFEKRATRMFWLIFSVFLIVLWSGLVLKLAPESAKSIALLIYYTLGILAVYKLYRNNLNKVIYECSKCKTRFKGNSPEPFIYKEWSKNEYNKSLKKDAQ
jgi:DNA-directed RNA polymerase subunit RPC12/RpoP